MKANIYETIKVYTCTAVATLLLCCAIVACNDVMEGSLKYDYPAADIGNLRSGHVLLVVMDGVSGTSMMSARNAEKAPNITAMLSTALYTDFGLGDISDPTKLDAEGLTDARGWANLLVGNTTHDIKTSDDLSPDSPVDNLVSYLAESGSNVSLYASDETIRKSFGSKASSSPEVTNDMAVRDAVLTELKQEETSELIVAQLRGVVEAVGDGLFYDDRNVPTTTVTNAIGTLDGYVGEIWETLKSRPRFSKENWLVIVTSNYGGLYKPGEEFETYYEDLNRNTFTLMCNDRLKQQVQGFPGNQVFPYSYYTPSWSFLLNNLNPTTYAESARLGDTTLGEFKFSQNESKNWVVEPITIQFFMKGSARSLSRSCLFSKSTYARENGWNIALAEGNQLMTCVGQWTWQVNVRDIDWTSWHVITWMLVPDPTNKSRSNLKMYVDGQLKGTSNTYNNSELRNIYLKNESRHGEVSKSPLRLGSTDRRGIEGGKDGYYPHWNWEEWATGNNTRFYITNIQLYNTVIPEVDINKYLGMTKLHLQKESYPYWKNMIGYWPCDLEEDEGSVYLKNYADPVETETDIQENMDEHAFDFHIDRGVGTYIANVDASSSVLSPYLDPELVYGKTIKTIDIPRQIFLWLSKSIQWNWNQKGQAWQFIYREMADEQK